MEYNYLNHSLDLTEESLPESSKINIFLQKNHLVDIKKALEFLGSESKFLYIHGFYLLADDESVDEMCKGLGYVNWEDYMIKNNYVNENNEIDKSIWDYENMKVVVPIMVQGRQK